MRRITLFPIYSREVLQRINPTCVIEWTATPREPKTDKPLHNVLISIPAEKLQAEEMVKLPIAVTEHADWEQAVQGAIAEQQKLKQAAKESNDTVRPIVLYQAQDKNQEVPPQTLKAHLIEAALMKRKLPLRPVKLKNCPKICWRMIVRLSISSRWMRCVRVGIALMPMCCVRFPMLEVPRRLSN